MAAIDVSSSVLFAMKKYDVFLSFRGADTRNNFVSHLHQALCQKKIETYIDDRLERGDEISPALRNAIEDSKIAVIILSKNYASSTWCLNELVHILDCKKENGLFVIPVFYRINPSHVRKQEGKFVTAFAELGKRFKEGEVQAWRAALTQVANISGRHSLANRLESKLVEAIITDILKILNRTLFSNDFKGLVGISQRIEKIESLLSTSSSNVHTVGVWGMGGIGKTTLVHVVYRKLFSQFEGHYFLLNTREELEKCGGLICLQNKILAGLSGEENLNLASSPFVKERLRRKKVLLVLDDVTSSCLQLECIARKNDWFGLGSRIIVATRDLQVLENIGVDEKYEVKELSYHDAFELFCVNAFKGNFAMTTKLLKLSEQVVTYCKGIPLALVVLGSHLHHRREEAWECAITKFAEVPHDRIQNVLRISYDELNNFEKDIFLDLACFFKGGKRKLLEIILDGCHFYAKIGLDVLLDKSLITLRDDRIQMHDLLQQMGQEIVRQESVKEPGKRSRLWITKDIQHVLETNTGTALVEGIFLNMSKIRELHLHPTTFSKMHNLRLLKFYDSDFVEQNQVCLPDDLCSLPNSLRYLYWHGYPCKSLPPNFTARNLIELSMPHSRLEKLWDGTLKLGNLKKIDLSYSSLTQIPDLSEALKLETVRLNFCENLLQLHPYFQNLKELTALFLGGCSSLEKFPELPSSIRILDLSDTPIKDIPSCIDRLSSLEVFELSYCKKLKSLPTAICKLKSLANLNLSFSRLENFPDILEPMESLSVLELNGTQIRELPASIDNLVVLCDLFLESCQNLEYLPDNISSLKFLEEVSLVDCSKLKSLPKFQLASPFVNARGCMSLETPSKDDLDSQYKGQSFVFTDYLNHRDMIFDPPLGIKRWSNFLDQTGFGSSYRTFCQGNEIPMFFDDEAMGSSITVELVAHWLPRSEVRRDFFYCLRFSLCVVASFENYYSPYVRGTLSFCCQSQFKSKDEKSHKFKCFLRGLGEEDDDQIRTLKSNHLLFMWYDFGLYVDSTEDIFTEASFDFYPVDGSKYNVDFCKVIKCGVRVTNAVSLQGLNDDFISREIIGSVGLDSGADDDDDDDDPKSYPKRIKV
ncbi:TIR-NBS-LRR-like protein [Trema orientale]|uniref:TIR-NBS-LRR-like protein n=1 Tax=Trema orientale TaxID=63057 RepID=A0A2P5FMU8_TREOI|nr:TIR-NBS-LRR-like protein [Trema orientale]